MEEAVIDYSLELFTAFYLCFILFLILLRDKQSKEKAKKQEERRMHED